MVNASNFSSFSLKNDFSFHLPLKEVHVWLHDLDSSKDQNSSFISSSERNSLAAPFFEKRFQESRRYLTYLLSCYLEITPELLRFEKTTDGKPFLRDYPEFFFSIAHSNNLLALVFGRHPVGIDVEKKRKVKAVAIAKKFFAPHESEFLNSTAEENFFYLWTAKEAGVKADGCGITKGLRHATVMIEENTMTGLFLNERKMHLTPWFLKEEGASSDKDFIGAVASFEVPSLIRWHDARGADSLVG